MSFRLYPAMAVCCSKIRPKRPRIFIDGARYVAADLRGNTTFFSDALKYETGLLAAARSAISAFDAHLAQQNLRRAEAGEAALQQVEANESGEGEEPFADENRAAGIAQRQGEQDEEAGHDANHAFSGHC